MLRRARIRAAASFVLVFLVIVASGALVFIYEPTGQQAKQEAKNESDVKAVDILASERVAYYTKILAMFTGALTGFGLLQIWFLIKSDETARVVAEANTKATRVAAGVELPRFILKSITLTSLQQDPRHALESGSLYIDFKNHGRTAAAIVGECFEWRVAKTLPPEPNYPLGGIYWSELGTVVERDDTHRMPSAVNGLCARGRPITEEEATRVLRGEDYLWIYGFISYRDFLGETHMSGFCVRLEILHARLTNTGEIDREMMLRLRFIQDGPKAYTYNR